MTQLVAPAGGDSADIGESPGDLKSGDSILTTIPYRRNYVITGEIPTRAAEPGWRGAAERILNGRLYDFRMSLLLCRVERPLRTARFLDGGGSWCCFVGIA
jgi:hypothetical protein